MTFLLSLLLSLLMKSSDININLVEAYIGLLKNLNADSKLEFISRLSKSMKTQKPTKTDSLHSLYGAFRSDRTADELAADIKKGRTFNRKRAEL